MLVQHRLIFVFRLIEGIDDRRPLLEVDLLALGDAEILRIDFHFDLFAA
jgi:hypothetical protein